MTEIYFIILSIGSAVIGLALLAVLVAWFLAVRREIPISNAFEAPKPRKRLRKKWLRWIK